MRKYDFVAGIGCLEDVKGAADGTPVVMAERFKNQRRFSLVFVHGARVLNTAAEPLAIRGDRYRLFYPFRNDLIL